MKHLFQPQELWGGATNFHDALGAQFAVATQGTSGGNLIELWAFKSGTRLSSSTVGTPCVVATSLVSTSLPTPMSDWDDQTGFKTYAISLLGTGTIEYFRHRVGTF
jgi:hypothetical protein